MTNQTFDLLKNLWWMLGVIVVVVLFLVKLGYSLREQKLRIQVLERDVKVVCQDSGQLTVATLAILDGLKQLKCDGEVTSAHVALKTYLATSRVQHIDKDS